MVNSETIEKWQCPHCKSVYQKEHDAEICQDTCLSDMYREPLREVEEITHSCEMCGKKFQSYIGAQNCEDIHKMNNDFYYGSFIDKEEKEKLKRASEHPKQKSLWWLK